MGIKNLLKFINSYDDIIKIKTGNNYYYEKIAIDVSIILYQVTIAIRNSGADLTNQKGEITSHILGLFNKTINLLKRNIIPIYVFDGKPPEFKKEVLKARKLLKEKAYNKLTEIDNNELSEDMRIKYFKRTVTITKKQIEECRELLELMGIPYVNAPEEADSQCASLVKKGIAQSVLTEDMDILTFGSKKIYRNLTSKNKQTLEIELDKILEKTELTYEQFVEFCILLGCDYCDRIKDLEPLEIFNYYIKHKNIPDTINDIKNNNINVPDMSNYQEYKDYFINPPAIEVNKVKLQKPNITKLLDLLVNNYGLIKLKVLPKLIYLENNYNKNKN